MGAVTFSLNIRIFLFYPHHENTLFRLVYTRISGFSLSFTSFPYFPLFLLLLSPSLLFFLFPLSSFFSLTLCVLFLNFYFELLSVKKSFRKRTFPSRCGSFLQKKDSYIIHTQNQPDIHTDYVSLEFEIQNAMFRNKYDSFVYVCHVSHMTCVKTGQSSGSFSWKHITCVECAI